jgi:DNA helicase-2/ATP-dependent DNA helicase PcrA
LAASPVYGLPTDDVFKFAKAMRETHRSLWELLAEADSRDYSAKALEVAGRLRDDLTHFAATAPDVEVGRLLYAWMERTGYLKQLGADRDPSLEPTVRNLAKLFERLKQFAHASTEKTAAAWVKHFEDIVAIEEESVATETDLETDAVRIMTVHAAKGLEFDTVFIPASVQNKFPKVYKRDSLSADPLLKVATDKESHLAEERRLFYVAMTRARRELFLTVSTSYGGKASWKLSQFVTEALGPDVATTMPDAPDDPLRRIGQSRTPAAVATAYRSPERISLSHTSISAYRTCPLKYYWEHVVGLKAEPAFALTYGTLIHEVIQRLNLAKAHGEKVSLKTLLGWYEEGWRNEHFLSEAHQEQMHERGRRTLERFYKEEQTRAPATAVEQRFRFPLSGCVVEGKYDRVDEHHGMTTIVDYKTGSVPDQIAADKRAKDDDQLTIYALAFHEQHGQLPAQVVLNFVDSGLAGVSTRTEKQIETMRQTIEDVAVGIRAGRFEPNLSAHECSPFADCPGHKVPHRTSDRRW